MLRHISANSLRANLSFLASDLLEGRDTPSRGLDIAAEYIAAQFRGAGLEPVGDDGYFQTAVMTVVEPVREGFEMTVEQAGRTISMTRDQIAPKFHTALDISRAGIYKLNADAEKAVANLKPGELADKIVVVELAEHGGGNGNEASQKFRRMMDALERANPKLVLLLAARPPSEPANRLVAAGDRETKGPPRIVVRSSEFFRWYESLRPGLSEATLTMRLPASLERSVKLHNVIGLLRGSDPVLKDTYVLLTAHYDHIGMKPDGAGDRIYNGANDDGSGTVSVIEIASALATLETRPKRSLVFMTFFGEEEGELGSKYYAQHPVFPIEKTIGDVNLEQLGRTDASDGRKIAEGTFTGSRYSDLPRVFQSAGARTGVRVLNDDRYGDSYFSRSDNEALARLGIPAHTLAVAFDFPDYHGVGDEWQKIDYNNMAKVDRMVALGLIVMADNPQPPLWNESERKAEPFVKAWKEHHPDGARTQFASPSRFR